MFNLELDKPKPFVIKNEIKMKYILMCIIFMGINISNAQTKKEQIEFLIKAKDSLNYLLEKERFDNAQKIIDLNSKVSQVNSQNTALNNTLNSINDKVDIINKEIIDKSKEIKSLKDSLQILTSNLEKVNFPDKKLAKLDFFGIYQGVQPSYNLKNKNGEDMVVKGKKILVNETDYKFLFKENNVVCLEQTDINQDVQYNYNGTFKIIIDDIQLLKIKCTLTDGLNSNPVFTIVFNKSDSTVLCIAKDTPDFKLEKLKITSKDFEFAFIAENKYIIISDNPMKNWVNGKPKLLETEMGYSACNDLKLELLPAEYLELLHNNYSIYNDRGNFIIVKIKSLKILTSYIPADGQWLQWNGNEGESEIFTDEEIAQSIWYTGKHKYLVAEFETESEIKKGDVYYFAIPSNKSASVFVSTVSTKSEEVKNKITKIVNQTKDYIDIQKEFKEKSGNNLDKWWSNDFEDFAYFKINNKETYALLGHTEGMFDFESRFSIWKIIGDSLPQFQHIDSLLFHTILATDIDGDNIPEFLIDRGYWTLSLLQKKGAEWKEIYSWWIPNYSCSR